MAKKREKIRRTLWLARDKDYRSLHLFDSRPEHNTIYGFFYVNEGMGYMIDPCLFDDVVYEDSPREIEVIM